MKNIDSENQALWRVLRKEIKFIAMTNGSRWIGYENNPIPAYEISKNSDDYDPNAIMVAGGLTYDLDALCIEQKYTGWINKEINKKQVIESLNKNRKTQERSSIIFIDQKTGIGLLENIIVVKNTLVERK